MKLMELLKMVNEDTAVRITLDGTYILAHCDVHTATEEYGDYTVNNMFATTIWDINPAGSPKPCISIDTSSPFHVEIWRTPDGDDWAKVNVDNQTGMIIDIQASGWDWAGELPRTEAMKMCAEDGGYTEFDPSDTYDSYEEWNDCVSGGYQYDYL